MHKPVFMKLGMYIMAPEPISAAYFINPSHHSVCLNVYPTLSLLGNGSVDTFPWQRIQTTIEELLEASFSIRSVGLSVYLLIVARQRLSKRVAAAL
jgi:hypothetical protein